MVYEKNLAIRINEILDSKSVIQYFKKELFMKFILFFVLFATQIFASNLLTYNVYERTDRVDIMLSFDAPYEGNIFQKREKDTTSLILNSLSYDQSASKDINSKIIQGLDIEPKQNSLVLNLRSNDAIIVNASKTTDSFGLRIRVTPKKYKNSGAKYASSKRKDRGC